MRHVKGFGLPCTLLTAISLRRWRNRCMTAAIICMTLKKIQENNFNDA